MNCFVIKCGLSLSVFVTYEPKGRLRAWNLGLATSHTVQVQHGCLHGNTFGRLGSGLVLRVGPIEKLDPTLNTSPANIFASNHQNPFLVLINHMLMVSNGSKVGTLPPCWDLGLGTLCEPTLSLRSRIKRLPFTLDLWLASSPSLYVSPPLTIGMAHCLDIHWWG